MPIDYYVAGEPADDLHLEILDAAGHEIRTISSTPAPEAAQAGGRRGGGPASLPKKAWHSRFTWDLRTGPGGPLVVPGSYQVRLVAGDLAQSRTVEVRIDPRVAADGVTPADLQEQFDLATKIRDAQRRRGRWPPISDRRGNE